MPQNQQPDGSQPSGKFQHQISEIPQSAQLTKEVSSSAMIEQPIDYLPTIVDVSNQLTSNGVVAVTIIAFALFVREVRLLVMVCKG